MTRLLALAVVLLALLGAIAFFLLPEESTDTPQDGVGVEEQAPEQLNAAPGLSAPESSDLTESGDESRSVVSSPEPVETETELAAVEASLPKGEGILIRIVRKEDKSPLAKARVLYLDDASFDEGQATRALAMQRSLEQVLEQFGRAFEADKDGELVVPYARGFAFVHARKDEFAGIGRLGPDIPQPFILELEPELAVKVRVLDKNGRGVAKVPTTIRMYRESWSTDTVGARTRGPDGLAVIRGLDILMNERMSEIDLRAAIALPLPEPVEAQLDLEDLPDEGFELRLPPTGSIVVHVVDENGAPLEGRFHALARQATGNREDAIESWREPLDSQGGIFLEGEGGEVEFPWVGLELELDLLVRMLDTDAIGWMQVEGPKRDGQKLEFDLQPVVADPLLVGKILRHDGEPLRESLLEVVRGKNRGGHLPHKLSTDAEGGFRIPLENLPPDYRFESPIRLRHGGQGDRPDRSVTIDLPQIALLPGEIDLGVLQLTEEGIVVSGVVMDTDRNPLAGASLIIESKEYWGDDRGQYNWSNLLDRRTSARDGSFSFHGQWEPGEYRLRAQRTGHEQRYFLFQLGERNLLVELNKEARLSGSLLVEEDLLKKIPLSLSLTVKSSTLSGPESPSNFWTRPNDEGEFEWFNLPTGTAKVQIRVSNTQQEIMAIEGIPVAAGEHSRDPRLQAIDLRGTLRVVTVSVVDEQGNPLDDSEAITEVGDTRMWIPGARGRFDVPLIGEEVVNMRVEAPGYKSHLLQDVREDQEVVLQPAPSLLVILESAPSLEQGWRLQVLCSPDGDSGHRSFGGGSSAYFDASGQARLDVQHGGPQRLDIALYKVGGTGGRFSNVHLEPNNGEPYGRFNGDELVGESILHVRIGESEFADAREILELEGTREKRPGD